MSVDFICSLGKYLKKSNKFMETLKSSVVYDKNNREALPLFSSIAIINDGLLQKQQYVALVIIGGNKKLFLFEFVHGVHRYIANPEVIRNYPCYVVYGITKQKETSNALYISLIKLYMRNLSLIEMSAAMHPQLVNKYNPLLLDDYNDRFSDRLSLCFVCLSSRASRTRDCILQRSEINRTMIKDVQVAARPGIVLNEHMDQVRYLNLFIILVTRTVEGTAS